MAASKGEYQYDFLLAYDENDISTINDVRKDILETLESESPKQKGFDLLRDSAAGHLNDLCHLMDSMSKSRNIICLMTESSITPSSKIFYNSLFVQLAQHLLLRRNAGGSVIPLFHQVSPEDVAQAEEDPDHPLYSLLSIIGSASTEDENWLYKVKMAVRTPNS